MADDRITPDEALRELLAGNERFVSGQRSHPHQDAERRASLVQGQRPFAVIFGCSDSRLAAEIIFDRGLGDLFVVRTAGHILGSEVLASIEYGVRVLGASLLVVLGHDSCGAVQAAHDVITGAAPRTPATAAIVDRVASSLALAAREGVSDLDEVSTVHVRHTVADLAAALHPGDDFRVVGLAYRLAEGRVTVVA
jgi:carbonic anhydrase